MSDAGRRLKIPVWMLSPEAAHFQLSDQAVFAVSALRALAALIKDISEEGFETLE